MPKLLHCRRGSVAFATVVALVPLIGAVALGAEAASWYVTMQQAQNAADGAAYSGGLALACSKALTGADCPDTVVANTQLVDYRGKQFAAKNAFCNRDDTKVYDAIPYPECVTTLPKKTSQTVLIDIGVYNAGTWTPDLNGQFVRARVSQLQPVYLAGVLGLSTVNPGAQAIARVNQVKEMCALGLGRYAGSGSPQSALEFAGSQTMSGNGCAFQSNNTVKFSSAPTFNGPDWAVYASAGCQNGGTCDPGVPHNFNMSPAANPLAKLDNQPFNTWTASGNKPLPCALNPNDGRKHCSPNSSGPPYNKDFTVSTGDKYTLDPGTYFFYNAKIAIHGGDLQGTGVTIVLLGNSSLDINGGAVSLSANFNNTTYPDLNGVLIDDQAPNKSNLAVTINGSAGVTVALGGAMYFPNVDVTMSGNSQNANTDCSEVIANSLKFGGGTAYTSTHSCAPGTVPMSQVVTLVY